MNWQFVIFLLVHAMAQQTSLNLSVLKEDVEYPLTPGISEGRCLIHVKLTESCARAIDNLITSHKVSNTQLILFLLMM